MYHTILYDLTTVEGGAIATIRLNRPERKNSIGPEMANEILYALENAEKEEEIDEAVEDDDVQSIEISPAVTVADDDLCTITITEKFKDDWGDIGFVVNITNKSDKDLTFYAPSGKTNVNGTMKEPWFSAHLMPGTNATEEFTFSSGELDSLDDLVNTTIGIDAYLTDSYEDVASYTATIA